MHLDFEYIDVIRFVLGCMKNLDNLQVPHFFICLEYNSFHLIYFIHVLFNITRVIIINMNDVINMLIICMST